MLNKKNAPWVVLVINRVLDRPNQVRYQRIVALSSAFNVVVVTKARIPSPLEAMAAKVCVERSGWSVVRTVLAECKRLKAAGLECMVHTQYAPVPLVAGYLCKRNYGVKWIYDLWDHPSLGWIGGALPLRLARQTLWKAIFQRLIVHADAWIIAMHPGILAHMPPAPVSCRLIFMRPGFDSGDEGNSTTSRLPAEPVKVAYVGSVSRRRGLDLLIDWARTYRGPGVELHIAGPCSDPRSEQLLKAMERPGPDDRVVSVRVLGEVRAQEVDRLLRDADIALAPVDTRVLNYRYAYPVKIVQYMSHGLIVLATESHGTRAVIDDGVNGFLFAYDLDDFKDAMDRALEVCGDPQEGSAMRNAARSTAEEYRWPALNAHLISALQSLAGRETVR